MTKIPCFTIILYICLVLYSLQNALNYALFQLLAVAIFGKTHIFQKNIGGFITVERHHTDMQFLGCLLGTTLPSRSSK